MSYLIAQLRHRIFLVDYIIEETEVLLQSDYELNMDSSKQLQSDCDITKAKANLDQLLNDPENRHYSGS